MSTSPQSNPNRDGKLVFPARPTIPFIEGDGVGPEIMRSAQQVVNAAVAKAYNGTRSIEWLEVYAGKKAEVITGSGLPDQTLATFKKHHIGLKEIGRASCRERV